MSQLDRSKAYEKGISQGAPEAIQVADRFHLLQNLAETLAQIFCTHAQVLRAVEIAHSKSTLAHKPEDEMTVVLIAPPAKEFKEQSKATDRRTKRLAIYEQIQALRSQGYSGRTIAESIGIGRTTVFRHLRHATFPERLSS